MGQCSNSSDPCRTALHVRGINWVEGSVWFLSFTGFGWDHVESEEWRVCGRWVPVHGVPMPVEVMILVTQWRSSVGTVYASLLVGWALAASGWSMFGLWFVGCFTFVSACWLFQRLAYRHTLVSRCLGQGYFLKRHRLAVAGCVSASVTWMSLLCKRHGGAFDLKE